MFKFNADTIITSIVEPKLKDTNTSAIYTNGIYSGVVACIELNCEVSLILNSQRVSNYRKVYFLFGEKNSIWYLISKDLNSIAYNKLDVNKFKHIQVNDLEPLSITNILSTLQTMMEVELESQHNVKAGDLINFSNNIEIKRDNEEFTKYQAIQYTSDKDYKLIRLVKI